MDLQVAIICREVPSLPGRARMDIHGQGHCLAHYLIAEAAKVGVTKITVVGPENILPEGASGIVYKQTPISLMGSDASLGLLTRYALGEDKPSAVLTLTLDAPFVTSDDIISAWKMFRMGRYQSVVAVTPESSDVMKQLRRGRRGLYHEELLKRKVYSKLGSLVVTSTEYLSETGNLIGMKSGILVFPAERALRLLSGWDLMAAKAYADEFRRIGLRPSEPRI